MPLKKHRKNRWIYFVLISKHLNHQKGRKTKYTNVLPITLTTHTSSDYMEKDIEQDHYLTALWYIMEYIADYSKDQRDNFESKMLYHILGKKKYRKVHVALLVHAFNCTIHRF